MCFLKISMLYRFITILLLVGCHTARAQVITLTDGETRLPVELATLMSTRPVAFTATNAAGQAELSPFRGAERIEIRCLGYQSVVISYAELGAGGYQLQLQPAALQFDELVVSATRWGQPSRFVPSRIAVITPKAIALHNPQTAADLLGTSGEVFIQKSQQGGGSPMIRGFATNRLLYSVDGVRMNTAIFRAGNIQNVISLDPFVMEKVEVFFGPGAVIYGSDAIGGVMSFQTRNPQLSLSDKPLVSGQAVARYASANNEATGHADVSIGWRKWALLTSVSRADFGDLRMGRHGPDEYLRTFYVQQVDGQDQVIDNSDPRLQRPSGYAQWNLMQKLRFRPNERWDLQYALHYSETTDYARYDRLIERLPTGLPRSAVWNYGPQRWLMNLLSVAHSGGGWLYDKLTLRLAQQYFEESRIDRNFSGSQRFRLRTNREQVQALSANADFEKLSGRHRFHYGLEYVFNHVNSTGSAVDIRNGAPIAVAARYPLSDWSSYGAYLNYQWTALPERLLLQAGLRLGAFDLQADFRRQLDFYPFDFSSTENRHTATTGSLGLVFSPSADWKLHANLSSGFRAPNVDDMGKIFDFVGGEVIVPNTALRAEYAWNGELAVTRLLGDAVRVDAAAFYTYLDNAMVRRPFQVDGQDSILYDGQLSRVYAIQNAAFGTVAGLQAGIEVQLPAGFGISTRYNYQRGREELDDGRLSRSRHAAPAFGVSRLSYRRSRLTAELYACYSAAVSHDNLNPEEQDKPAIYAKDANGNPYSPAWYTLNIKAMYAISPRWTLSAGLENITDQRYRPYSSGLVAPGRNFLLSLRAGF